MLRSLQYAAQYALMDRAQGQSARQAHLAQAWEDRNRAALLQGYYEAKGIEELLPPRPEVREAVRVAFELDKALYELGYEAAYRPAWQAIPRSALERMLSTPIDALFGPPGPDGASEDPDDGTSDDLPRAQKG